MSIKEYVVSHLVNLIKIKSVVTLALTTAFVILALRGEIAPDQFLAIFTMIIGFYFGTQKDKAETVEVAEEKQAEQGAIPAIIPTEIQYDAIYEPSDYVPGSADPEEGDDDGSI